MSPACDPDNREMPPADSLGPPPKVFSLNSGPSTDPKDLFKFTKPDVPRAAARIQPGTRPLKVPQIPPQPAAQSSTSNRITSPSFSSANITQNTMSDAEQSTSRSSGSLPSGPVEFLQRRLDAVREVTEPPTSSPGRAPPQANFPLNPDRTNEASDSTQLPKRKKKKKRLCTGEVNAGSVSTMPQPERRRLAALSTAGAMPNSSSSPPPPQQPRTILQGILTSPVVPRQTLQPNLATSRSGQQSQAANSLATSSNGSWVNHEENPPPPPVRLLKRKVPEPDVTTSKEGAGDDEMEDPALRPSPPKRRIGSTASTATTEAQSRVGSPAVDGHNPPSTRHAVPSSLHTSGASTPVSRVAPSANPTNYTGSPRQPITLANSDRAVASTSTRFTQDRQLSPSDTPPPLVTTSSGLPAHRAYPAIEHNAGRQKQFGISWLTVKDAAPPKAVSIAPPVYKAPQAPRQQMEKEPASRGVELGGLVADVAKAVAEKDRAERELEAALAQVQDLSGRLHGCEEEIKKLRQSNDAYQAKVEDRNALAVQLGNLREQTQSLKEDVSSANERVEKAQQHAGNICKEALNAWSEIENTLDWASADSSPEKVIALARTSVQSLLQELHRRYTLEIRDAEERGQKSEELEQVKLQLSEALSSITGLQITVTSQKTALDMLKSEKENLEKHTGLLKSENDKQQEQNSHNLAMLSKNMETCQDLFQKQVESLKTEKNKIRLSAQEDRDFLQGQLTEKDARLARLKSSSEELSNRITELERQVQQAQTEKSDCLSAIDKMKIELDNARGSSNNELKELRNQIQDHEQRIAKHILEAATATAERDLYLRQLTDAQEELKVIRQTRPQEQVDEAALETTLADLQAAVKDALHQLQVCYRANDMDVEALARIDTTPSDSTLGLRTALALSASGVKRMVESLALDVTSSKTQLSDAQQLLKQTEESETSLKHQLEKQNITVELLEKQASSMKADYEARLTTLQTKLDIAQEEVKTLSQSATTRSRDLETAEGLVNTLKAEKASLEGSLRSKQDAFDKLSMDLQELRRVKAVEDAVTSQRVTSLEHAQGVWQAEKVHQAQQHRQALDTSMQQYQAVREDLAAQRAERNYIVSQLEIALADVNKLRQLLQESQTAEAVAKSERQAAIQALLQKEKDMTSREDGAARVEILEREKKTLEAEVQICRQNAEDAKKAKDDAILAKDMSTSEYEKRIRALEAELASAKANTESIVKATRNEKDKELAVKNNEIKKLQNKLDTATERALRGPQAASQRPNIIPQDPLSDEVASGSGSRGSTPITGNTQKSYTRTIAQTTTVTRGGATIHNAFANRISNAAIGGAQVNRRKPSPGQTVNTPKLSEIAEASSSSSLTADGDVEAEVRAIQEDIEDAPKAEEESITRTSPDPDNTLVESHVDTQKTIVADESQKDQPVRATRQSARKKSTTAGMKTTRAQSDEAGVEEEASGTESQASRKRTRRS